MKKAYKRIKGVLSNDWLKKYDGQKPNHNLMLEAMTNPDLLSDEQGMYVERDFDHEQDRKKFLACFRLALRSLTPRQKEIVYSLQKYETQEEAAKSLRMSRSTIAVSLMQIQKKIKKAINNIQTKEQRI